MALKNKAPMGEKNKGKKSKRRSAKKKIHATGETEGEKKEGIE